MSDNTTARPLDLPELLFGLKAAARLIRGTRSRDDRRVMLGFFKSDLKKAEAALNLWTAQINLYRQVHRDLVAEAREIEARDGPPIAADDASRLPR
jgi:hypothetical protein